MFPASPARNVSAFGRIRVVWERIQACASSLAPLRDFANPVGLGNEAAKSTKPAGRRRGPKVLDALVSAQLTLEMQRRG
jgi:hypothetical protein